jgi:prophage regulatory protein
MSAKHRGIGPGRRANTSLRLSPPRSVRNGVEAAATERRTNAAIVRDSQRPRDAPQNIGFPLRTQIHSSLVGALEGLQLLTQSDVCKLLRISKPTLWRIRRSGGFPEPTAVTERVFGWRRSEIDAWLASRPNSREY